MKWLVLVVVVILTAPTLAKRLSGETRNRKRSGGIVYRTVRRHGAMKTGIGVVLVAIAVALFLGQV